MLHIYIYGQLTDQQSPATNYAET